jgi:hypothetical protein
MFGLLGTENQKSKTYFHFFCYGFCYLGSFFALVSLLLSL